MTKASHPQISLLQGNTVYVFHVSDGKITEAWVIPGDQYAQDAFSAD